MLRLHWCAMIALFCCCRPALAWEDSDCAKTRAGVVFVVGGISGLDPTGLCTKRALASAGCPHEVHEFVWTHGVGRLLQDLQDYRHVERKAAELAELLRKEQQREPHRPIYLIAKSGGSGIALQAAAQLPEGSLERIILLSAAVSADYDLRPALRAARQGIVSYHSKLDQLLLNLGTSRFGTIDRYYTQSAGLYGFAVPEGASAEDRALYDRLVQIPWQPAMVLSGYAGGHLGNSSPSFLRTYIAEWLR